MSSFHFQLFLNPLTTKFKQAPIKSNVLALLIALISLFMVFSHDTANAQTVEVQGNSTVISNGDTTPTDADGTDFGAVGIGAGTNITYFVLNTGNQNLTLTNPVVSGTNSGDFVVNSLPTSPVAPAAQTDFLISFNPSAVGLRQATVTFTTNDLANPTFTFDIQGTGVTPPGSFNVTSGNNQSTQINNAFALPLVVTLLDTNNTPIQGASVTFSASSSVGNPGGLFQGNIPSINVNTDANGQATATITANGNIGNHTVTASTSGIGQVQFNLSNVAADATAPRITSIIHQNPNTQNTSADTLTWRVTFDEPVQNINGGLNGDFSVSNVAGATLTINQISSSIYDITISGGTLPTLNATVTLAINNSTQDILDLAGNALRNTTPTGSNENSYILTNTGAGIPELNILGNFVHNIINGDNSPRIDDNTDFGNVDVDSGQRDHDFIVFNDGTGQLDLNLGGAPVLLSGDTSDFSIITQPSQSIASLDNSTLTIRFNPTQVGTRTALVTIPNNDPDENPFTFTIQGTGTDSTAPRIASLETLFVGAQTDADEIIWRIIFNETVNNLDLSDFTISGTTATLSVRTPPTNNPGHGTLIDIRASGGDLASLNGTITLSLVPGQNITDTSGNTLTNLTPTGQNEHSVQIINSIPDIRIFGDGPIPVQVLGQEIVDGQTATSVGDGTDFGNQQVGVESPRFSFRVQNTEAFSTLVANVSQVIVSGPAAADYTVTGSSNLTLPGNSASGFTISFTPSSVGPRNATITIVSNDPDESPFTFNITGNGLAGPPNAIIASSGTPQSQTINTAFTNPLVVTVTDANGAPVSGVTVNFAVPSSGASATLSANSAVTDANGHIVINATANSVAGTYNVTASSPGLPDATFALTNTAGPSANLVIVSGTPQTAQINTMFGAPLVARVTDGSGNPVPGINVNFAAPNTGASGTLSAPIAVTNANGEASVTITANGDEGTFNVTASSPGLTNILYSLTNTLVDKNDTIKLIGSFLETRSKLILQSSSDISRRLDRVNGRTTGNGNISGFGLSITNSAIPFALELGQDQSRFAYSLSRSQIRNSNSQSNKSNYSADLTRLLGYANINSSDPTTNIPNISGTLGDRPKSDKKRIKNTKHKKQAVTETNEIHGFSEEQTQTLKPFDLWIEGKYSRFDSKGGDGTFTNIHMGADYLLSSNTLIGLGAQFDWTTFNASNLVPATANGKADGFGYLIGPYLTSKLSDQLYFDARVAYGHSHNTISPYGTYSDDFETTRWLASAALIGEFHLQDLEVRPEVRLSWFREESESYRDSLSNIIPAILVQSGLLEFGPTFSTSFELKEDIFLSPRFAAKGIWTFAQENATNGRAIDPQNLAEEGIRARLEAGLDFTNNLGNTFSLSGTYDGIGDNTFESWSIEARASINW